MAYSVEHIRYTLECDACGLTEKRYLDAGQDGGTDGWSAIRTNWRSFFCCPGCLASVGAVLHKRELELQAAKDLTEATCAHDYQQRGLLMQCTKCKRFR